MGDAVERRSLRSNQYRANRSTHKNSRQQDRLRIRHAFSRRPSADQRHAQSNALRQDHADSDGYSEQDSVLEKRQSDDQRQGDIVYRGLIQMSLVSLSLTSPRHDHLGMCKPSGTSFAELG